MQSVQKYRDTTLMVRVEGQQRSVFAPDHNLRNNLQITIPNFQTPKLPQPKIDATDRRNIEAANEDKSRTTKEALADIKRVHQKETKKKEQNNAELSQIQSVSKALIQHLNLVIDLKKFYKME